jgi:CDP-diacylglycerol--glycerol-3-phosphate 3-phosphatidyltransferase
MANIGISEEKPITEKKLPQTFSDRARRWTKNILQPIAHYLHRRGVHPDLITFLGLGLVGIAAWAIIQEQLFIAGIILVVGLPLDALDGAIARLMKQPRPFGAFLDSTLDRYADGLIFGALVIYGERTNSDMTMILALVALVGAFAVSYTRARAEGLDLECKIGFFSRLERLITLLVLFFTGWVVPMLWILAIGTQFTGLQRMWYVYRITHSQHSEILQETKS